MILRTKLLLAQSPLAIALVVVGVGAVWSVSVLGNRSDRILRENYASVLAAEEMKESIERLDSAALFTASGEKGKAEPMFREHRQRFEQQLQVEEGNPTETGEKEATEQLRKSWKAYERLLDDYLKLPNREQMRRNYFDVLQPQFVVVKDAAQKILDINQDAMLKKSDAARDMARWTSSGLVAAAAAALLAGMFASTWFTNRLLRPLAVLTQAVSRLGQRDFAARALIASSDEIGQLAAQFNVMADHLQEYRSSSLGELLLAQRSSHATIDSFPDPVLVFDPAGNILTMNTAAESLWPETLGETSRTLPSLPPEIREPLDRARSQVLQGRGAFLPAGMEDAIGLTGTAGQRWFLLRATPIYDEDGRISGVTAVFQDVTRLQRLDQLKNDLVATVAHEFRTPLTSLRMAVHLCLEGVAGPLNDKQLDLLYAAREDCQRLQSTVDELLDLARIQSGKGATPPTATPAARLIDDAIAAFRMTAAEKKIELSGQSLLVHEQVLADPQRIQVVLSNLLANALRHTPEGGLIRIRALEADGALRFEVSDTGDGIAREFHEAIFERFYRVPGSSTGAAGLGLSICKEIVLAHGGQIGIESEPSHGSTFWFTLPLAPEPKNGVLIG